MNLRTYKFSIWVSTLIVISMVIIIFMMIIPTKVLDFKDVKYTVTTPVVKAGTTVEFQVKLIKYKDATGTISRQLMNSYIYNYSPVVGQISKGECDKLVRIEIPTYIEPGEYFLRNIYEYKVNCGLRTERYVHDTETFTIIKDDD